MSTVLELLTDRDVETGNSAAVRLRLLLSLILTMLLAVECLSRVMHNHRKVSLDIEGGIEQALEIRHSEGQLDVLIAGNSLVYEGVSRGMLQQVLPPTDKVYTAGVPGSTYHDWRYGLRSLFRHGSEPDVLLFAISPSQFIRPPTVTALPVEKLWRRQEIFSYYREERPGLTTLSELLMEHYSVFFSMRDTLRIYVRKAIPGYEAVVGEWAKSPVAPLPQAAVIKPIFLERLDALQQECAGHARLILLIVPTNQVEDAALEPVLRSAAVDLGIEVIDPITEREWPATSFQKDGYHLTPKAAIQFSSLAAMELTKLLAKQNGWPVASSLSRR